VWYGIQQYQRTDNIAIQKEHDFWQPPSERPYPLDLIISDVVNGRTRAQASYLLVQSDSMIIKQQRNERDVDVIVHLGESENCGSFRVEWEIAGC